jgi:hypothetical protein
MLDVEWQQRSHVLLTKPNNQGLLVKLMKMPEASSGGTNAIEVTRAERVLSARLFLKDSSAY